METANYLKQIKDPLESLKHLSEEYGIIYRVKSDQKLVILNYPQIPVKNKKIKKDCAIYRECRQLVLELSSWQVISRSLDRFFDLDSHTDDTKLVLTQPTLSCVEKLDGSLISLFTYDDKINLVSRGTFDEQINEYGYTWTQLFEKTLGLKLDQLKLDPNYTYIFELCTLHNRVVRRYDTPIISLLACRSRIDYSEYDDEQLDHISKHIQAIGGNVTRPQIFQFKNITDLLSHLEQIEKKDSTYEGFVIKAHNSGKITRCKIKTQTWRQLHHCMKGQSIILTPYLILQLHNDGKLDQIISDPAFTTSIDPKKLINDVQNIKQYMQAKWNEYNTITDQKTFAIQVTSLNLNPKLTSLYFRARSKHEDFNTLLSANTDAIIDYLKY